ncbi:MAG: beta-galactosidase [Planctomycetales bacterium]|nr:beta-galactosidase [Planctomycetales bacterium]
MARYMPVRINRLIAAAILTASAALAVPNPSKGGDAGSAEQVKPLSEKQFAHPERIRYDGYCFQIEGKDTFLYCATFHYFRTPKELWRDRFQKIKDAGFNTVETYTPWNRHERRMPAGLDDFSGVDVSELEAWLKMAQDEFGFYTIVRPGPFICAEWAGGGYPRWLAAFGPGQGDFWLRSADKDHIAWSVHWYDAVCRLFAREQLTCKPVGGKGIIMIQIENEYNYHDCRDKAKLLLALYDAVRRSGIDIPVFTCLTNECRASQDPALSQVFDCDNYYVGLTDTPTCALRMADLRKQQPDAPGFVAELQNGWFATIGGSLSEDHYSDSRHFSAIHWMSLLGGASGLVPYVFVGGTHFGNWGSRGQTTSYDFNASIREWGARGAKYMAARGIAQFIRENEARLLRSEGGPCQLQSAEKSLFGGVRIAADGTRFVFLLNNDPEKPAAGNVTLVLGQTAKPSGTIYNIDQNSNKVLIDIKQTAAEATAIPPFEVAYDLGPLGAGVLVIPPGKTPAEGVWYPKPQEPITRPATLPAPVRIACVLRRDEDFAARWQPLPEGKSLPELGVDDQRYTLYRAKISLSAGEASGQTRLLVNSFSRDIVTVQINGKLPNRTHPSDAYAASAHRNLDTSFTRIGPADFDNRFDAAGLLKEGENEFVFLYENIGHEHGYIPMEELCGIRTAGLGNTDGAIVKPLTLEVAADLGGIVSGWNLPGASRDGWKKLDLDTSPVIPRKGNGIQLKGKPDALLTWYRMEFELPAADPAVFVPWALRILASGNGEMYLNGHNIGRHFEAGQQREYYLPECWLNFGPGQKNVIALGLRQTINGAVIGAAEIAPYPDAAEIRK